MDLGLLAYAWRDGKTSREQVLGTGGAILGVALLDAQTAIELSRAHHDLLAQGITVKQSVTVQRTPAEAYAFFRELKSGRRDHRQAVRPRAVPGDLGGPAATQAGAGDR